jgi:hypothetical protein
MRPPTGGIVCHVLNRANARLPLFQCQGDYELFERTLQQAHQRVAMRTLASCVMPNHWCLVLWPRTQGDADQRALLNDPPSVWPTNWVKWVNRPQTEEEEQALASCIARGRPFGTPEWVAAAASQLGMETTLRPRGRPKKSPEKGS